MSDKLKAGPRQVSSTRSVGVNLATAFQGRGKQQPASRRVATHEGRFNRRYATKTDDYLIPALPPHAGCPRGDPG